jgi:hypothetical protein
MKIVALIIALVAFLVAWLFLAQRFWVERGTSNGVELLCVTVVLVTTFLELKKVRGRSARR